MHTTFKENIPNLEHFIEKLSKYAEQFEVFSLLCSNQITSALQKDKYELVAGIGAKKVFSSSSDCFETLNKIENNKSWAFGYLSYELKDELWKTCHQESSLPVQPTVFWFEPKYVILIEKESSLVQIMGDNPALIYSQIENTTISQEPIQTSSSKTFEPVISKDEYLRVVNTIRENIIEGDFYEMNFCQEFVCQNFDVNPFQIWEILNQQSKVPFSAFFRNKDFYVLSASPERFLTRRGETLVSQPIKGTAKVLDNMEDNKLAIENLKNDPKEQAENIMIVDLVRNDLCRCCETGSVKVEELCQVYSFPKVHQMISTISGQLRADMRFSEIIQYTFPMGSMTGAPKKIVVERAAQYEKTSRGVYSGSLGYIEPNGDFDLNVVIRSLLVDTKSQIASYHVGGAITYDSIPENEFEECLVKAAFWNKLFG